jgi:hypothetical protein
VNNERIKKEYPYYLNNSIFTDKESKFYKSLKKITDELGLTVFTKIRIADLVYTPRNHPYFITWFNHIKSKHVDFIICDENNKLLLVIEVDDKTHYIDSRKNRDKFIDDIFFQFDINVMHVMYWNYDELKRNIITELYNVNYLKH